ncbi:MAG: DNA repair protein RecO [Coriobacteriales bacterium]|jgi:DNA repair protein RecO (recombination protein O)|nr:DNA repair protein RecO [Coriobacteriales bacterium]
MASYPAEVLVLKKTKLGETDLILTLLSREGAQIRAVAKGARKPGSRLATHLELYGVASVLLHGGKNLDIVTEAQMLCANEGCRADVEHSAGAAVLVELLEKVTRDSEVEARLFPLSVEALRCLGAVPHEGIPLIVAATILKVLAQLGYRPALDSCANCGSALVLEKNRTVALSIQQGGLLCSVCARQDTSTDRRSFDTQRITWIQTLLGSRYVDLEHYVTEEYATIGTAMLDFARDWMRAHLLPTMRSLDFLYNFNR